jgi:SAM-dependent methyltransferase
MSDVSSHGIECLLRPRTVARKCHPCPRTVLLPLSLDRTALDAHSDKHKRARFDEIFSRVAQSDVLARLWRDVYRDDYPKGASPFSFITTRELLTLSGTLGVTEGGRFADIACGQGGPSLFVARETGAAVVGIDSSRIAVHCAASVARKRGFAGRATFIVADAAATSLREASMDGAISIDALQLISDRSAVLTEVGRIVMPGGRFAFTTWVSRQAGTGPAFPVDYQPLLETAGFTLEWCHEPPDWEQRETAVFARIRESSDRLEAELGRSVATMLVTEAAKMPDAYPLIRRVNIVARRD